MDTRTAHTLSKLNNHFYAEQTGSFSRTRRSPWQGWVRLADLIRETWGEEDSRLTGGSPLTVLDVACGNLRFERFLQDEFPHADIQVVAMDACAPLVPQMEGVQFVQVDIVEDAIDSALDGSSHTLMEKARQTLHDRLFDLVVCFGFFHHVPGEVPRAYLLQTLLAFARGDAISAVSLWRYMDDEGFAAKTLALQKQAFVDLALQGFGIDLGQFDEGDHLLGWQNKSGVYRYCHSFSDGEIARLIRFSHVNEGHVVRYRSDGRSSASNEYVVVR